MAFTSSASESSGGGNSAVNSGMFGLLGPMVAKALSQAVSDAPAETASAATKVRGTSEEAPGNAQNMKKGGKVKGWGKARGARAAKYY